MSQYKAASYLPVDQFIYSLSNPGGFSRWLWRKGGQGGTCCIATSCGRPHSPPPRWLQIDAPSQSAVNRLLYLILTHQALPLVKFLLLFPSLPSPPPFPPPRPFQLALPQGSVSGHGMAHLLPAPLAGRGPRPLG